MVLVSGGGGGGNGGGGGGGDGVPLLPTPFGGLSTPKDPYALCL